LDPASVFINANYGLYLYRARRWPEAITQFQRVIELDPNLPMGHGLQALVHVENGDLTRALAGFHRGDQLSGEHHAYHVMLGYGHATAGNEAEARRILAEIEGQRAEQNVWLVMLAMSYAKLGDTDHALDLLEDAYRERGGWIVWAGVEPGLDGLRQNVRFRSLMARLGLPQADSPPAQVIATDAEPRGESNVGGRTRGRQRQSLLVLPFENTSPDPENEYLGDGLTDELITDLTKVRSIRIIARNTSMKLKHTEKTIASLGRELDVGYVLEGSVRRTGEDVRITTQLVDTADESPIWAERYTGTMEHVFDLQEKVSRAIVDALNVELSREERDALSARPFPNPLAYEYYLKARRDIYEFDGAALERALQNLREGEAIHGSTVPILRGLGLVHMQMLNAGVTEDESLIDEVERYAARIRDIAPSSADAFVLAGCAQVLRGDFQKGVMLLAQAHSRDRHDPDTMLWLGVSMLSTGQPDRSRLIIDELVRIDPLAPLSHLLVGYTAFFQGRFDDSVAPLRRSLDLGPDVQVSLWCAVRLFAAAGLPHEAHAAAQHLQAQHAGTPFAESAGIFAAAVNGHTDDIGEPSEKLRAWAVRDAEWGQYLADAYALAGRDRDALDWLHTSVNAGFLNDTYLAEHDPFVSGLRDSQELTALLEKVARARRVFEAELDAAGVAF
jgi:TolB-like protein/Tfp pilus assembly protein PilF